MRFLQRMIRAVAVTAFGMGCGPAIRQYTVVSPEANLAGLRVFSVLPGPRVRPGVGRLPPDDPMLVNSAPNIALRRALVQSFESHGYAQNDAAPDFVVAYYASAQEPLDVMWWDFGYLWRPPWWRGWGPGDERLATQYVAGTVIIDVLDAQGQELLWRGRAIARIGGSLQEYVAELRRTVTAIVNEFPVALPPVVAAAERRGGDECRTP